MPSVEIGRLTKSAAPPSRPSRRKGSGEVRVLGRASSAPLSARSQTLRQAVFLRATEDQSSLVLRRALRHMSFRLREDGCRTDRGNHGRLNPAYARPWATTGLSRSLIVDQNGFQNPMNKYYLPAQGALA